MVPVPRQARQPPVEGRQAQGAPPRPYLQTLIGIDAHRLLIDCSWIAHGEFIGWHWLASTGEAGGWQGGLFNHVPPARHRPYIALFFSLIFLMDGSLIAHCRFRERFGGC